LAGSGSYARGEQPRSVPDSLAAPYRNMVAEQRAYNARQEAAQGRPSGGAPPTTAARRGPTNPLAERMYRPPPEDVAELRRLQAEQKVRARAASRENAWMAVPALAPAAAVLGLEAAALIAARLAAPVVARGPLVLTEPMPYLRVGDNWATRAGRRAHRFYKDMARDKPGWEYEPRIAGADGRTLKPDLRGPARTPDPTARKYVEVKPNTPSGRAAAARQVKTYEEATKQMVRALFYDPKRFM
jgi:hypothetical protein